MVRPDNIYSICKGIKMTLRLRGAMNEKMYVL